MSRNVSRVALFLPFSLDRRLLLASSDARLRVKFDRQQATAGRVKRFVESCLPFSLDRRLLLASSDARLRVEFDRQQAAAERVESCSIPAI